MLHDALVMVMDKVEAWGYWGVAILMAIESSIIPLPSEVVVPPAAIIAAREGAPMTFWGVVLAGGVGSLLGSIVMYVMALTLGRPFLQRFGKYFFMPPHKVEVAEEFMRRYSTAGILFARFLPVVRHLISIPAGLARVNFGMFCLVTFMGSTLWCGVLALFGNKIGREHPHILDSPELLKEAVKSECHLIVAGVLLLAVLYAIMKYMTRQKS